jgi:hypothetical protein
MPPAKKSAPQSLPRSPVPLPEPAALKQLTTKSLDAAEAALVELRKGAGRDVGQGARDLYGDLRTFVSSARSDTDKVAKALHREITQAQKQLARATAAASARTKPAGNRSSKTASAAKRSASTAR